MPSVPLASRHRAESARPSRRGRRWRSLAGVRGRQRPAGAAREGGALAARVSAALRRHLLERTAALASAARRSVHVRRCRGGLGARGAWLRAEAPSPPTSDATVASSPAAPRHRHPAWPLRSARTSRRRRPEGRRPAGRQRGRRGAGGCRRDARGEAARLSRLHHRARSRRQRGDAGQPRRARTAAAQARRRAQRHAHDGRSAREEADARADGASGARMAIRPRRRAARRVASGAVDREPRRRSAVQGGDRIAVPEHRGHAAHRPLGLDARTADADCRADGRDLRARPRALRRQVRGARLHDAGVGRRRARRANGRQRAIPRIPDG